MPDAARERIQVSLATEDKVRWGCNLIVLLFNGYPDEVDHQRVVRIEDTALRQRWTIPVHNASEGRQIRDRIEQTARGMSDAELDEWARTGRWMSV